MKERLKRIKYVFMDVDYTALVLYMRDENGKRTVGFHEYKDWLKHNINNDAYKDCEAAIGVKWLVEMLHENGARVFALTECTNSFEHNSKVRCLEREYAGDFDSRDDIISIDSRSKKVSIMLQIAERDGISRDEIMFIDDANEQVMEAFANGIFSMHTTEAMQMYCKEIMKQRGE